MAMEKIYSRVNWQNEPSEATALNDVNLNKMDSAINTLDDRIVTLSTEDDSLDYRLDLVEDGKVDKVTGKGLSEVKSLTVTKLTDVGTDVAQVYYLDQSDTPHATYIKNGITVDSALSSSSTNPVQNKVVKGALDNKVDKESGKGLSYYDVISVARETSKGSQIGSINLIYKDGNYESNPLYNGIEVDSSLDGTSENPVENKAIYDALNNLLPSKTVSGNPIAISDASGFNAKALTVSMNPIQDLHGYDNPWVGGAGKNLADKATEMPSGITVTVEEDGKLILNGTSDQVVYIRGLFNCPDDTATYTWAVFNTKPYASGVEFSVRKEDDTSAGGWSRVNAVNKTFTFTPDATPTKWQIQISSGVTFSNDVIAPMIVSGSVAPTSYEPYSNICPISGRTEASVKREGKNLFDIEKWLTDNNVTFSKVGDYYKFTVTNVLFSSFFEFPASIKTLTFDINQSETTATNFRIRAKLQDGTISSIDVQRLPYTANIVGVAFNWTTVGTLCIKVQVELGNQASEYHAYNGETHTHQYSETIYGGVDDFVNGGLTSEWKIVDLSTLTWTWYDTNKRWVSNAVSDMKSVNDYSLSGYYCDRFKDTTAHVLASDTSLIGFAINSLRNVAVRSGDEVNSPTGYVCYRLGTPTIIETSAEEITLLKGNNVLSTNADDMELKYSVSLDSLLPSTARTLSKSAPIEEKTEVVKEPEEETKEER